MRIWTTTTAWKRRPLRGDNGAMRRLADVLCAERGVHHGLLNVIRVALHAQHRHDVPAKTPSGGRRRAGA